MKINGREIAEEIFEELKKKITALKLKHIIPHIAIILVGNDPASVAYVNQKKKKAEEIGSKCSIFHLPSSISRDKLLKTIKQCNNDNNVHGIIVQRPLSKHIDSQIVNEAVDPAKDIDAFHPLTKFQMPLAQAVLKILEHTYPSSEEQSDESRSSRFANAHSNNNFIEWLRSKKIVIIGKGETGGNPIIQTLKKLGIEPLIIDSKTANRERITMNSDIIISTVGKPNIIKPENLKQGVILIGVGMHREENGKLQTDYNEDDIKDTASFYTSVPGGVGPVNVAMLLQNLVKASEALLVL